MDPMIIISLVSGLVFAFLGNWMARRRDASTVIWTLAGFFFPPTLIILKVWRWKAKHREAEAEAAGEAEAGDEER